VEKPPYWFSLIAATIRVRGVHTATFLRDATSPRDATTPSANGTAISQPRAKPWVRTATNPEV